MNPEAPQSVKGQALRLVRDLRAHLVFQREQGWSGAPLPQSDDWSPPSLASLWQPAVAPSASEPPRPGGFGRAVERRSQERPQAKRALEQIRSFGEPQAPRPPASVPASEKASLKPAPTPDLQDEGPLVIGAVPPMKELSLLRKTSLQEESQLYQRIGEIQQELGDCQRCELAQHRTHLMFGVGPLQSRLMVICPQPNAEEDREGQPTLGITGRLVGAMLKAIGLRREEVYIAYHMKCRPPEDRHPYVREVERCTPFLLEQIRALQPDLVLAMGIVAAQAILRSNQRLEVMRGRWFQLHESPILQNSRRPCRMLVTYHPLYLHQRPQRKAKAWQDLRMLREQLLCLAETD